MVQPVQKREPAHYSKESEKVEAPAAIAPLQPSSQVIERASTPKPFFMGFVFAITATVSALVGASLALFTPIAPAIAPNDAGQPPSLTEVVRRGFGYRVTRPVNILVMGIDRVADVDDDSPEVFTGRSDTMLLIRVDPLGNTASILSIPRDTQVVIPDIGVTKINHANLEGGSELAAQTVSETLNNVPIDRYLRLSTSAFRELVDLLGGVEVYVPQRMVYEDNTQKLKIDLEEGWQTLNGDEAEQFARFRSDGYGDVGRVQRQQQLLQALRNRVINPAVLPKIPEAIHLMQTYIDTNLSLEEMLALVNFGLGLEQDNLRMVMLPGRFSQPEEYVASYWLMDEDGRDRVMQDYFELGQGNVAEASPDHLNGLRIAIQNASGDSEAGQQVVDYLYDQGFNNVYLIQDWHDEQSQTQIIVQWGDLQDAEQLENLLGVGRVVAASTGDLDSDLTVRVGVDWEQQLNNIDSL